MASAGEIPALLFIGKESLTRLRTGPGPVIGSLGRPETEVVRSSAAGKSGQPGIGLDAQRHAPNLPHEDSDSGHRAGVLGTAEPDIVVPVRWCVPVPVCGSHIVRFIVPGPTADHKKRPTPYGGVRPPPRSTRLLHTPLGCSFLTLDAVLLKIRARSRAVSACIACAIQLRTQSSRCASNMRSWATASRYWRSRRLNRRTLSASSRR